jgi:hypothetical protein
MLWDGGFPGEFPSVSGWGIQYVIHGQPAQSKAKFAPLVREGEAGRFSHPQGTTVCGGPFDNEYKGDGCHVLWSELYLISIKQKVTTPIHFDGVSSLSGRMRNSDT